MGIGEWTLKDYLDLLGAIGMIAGLLFTAFSLRSETKTRRIANLLSITSNHREIWREFINNPKLTRVRDASADATRQPANDAERVFVTMVILHVNSVFYTMSDHLIIKYEGLRRDIAQFFSLPIPNSVWQKNKQFQNNDFVEFMDGILK